MIFSSLLVVAQLTGRGSVLPPHPAQAKVKSSEDLAKLTPVLGPDVADLPKEGGQLPSASEKEVLADMTQAEGEIVVTAKPAPPRSDPMQAVNRETFKVVRSVDKAVTGPLARGYKTTLPSLIRGGLRNALRNLGEPVVIVNYMLQLKPGKGLETLGRLAINSTVSVAGLFDVAKKRPFNLPYHANGLANTLGYYGVKPGPYMYLPLIGPTTVRDLAGRVGDVSLLPLALGGPFSDPLFTGPATVVRMVDDRAEADDAIKRSITDNADPYSATRSKFLKQRQAEIDVLRGRDKRE